MKSSILFLLSTLLIFSCGKKEESFIGKDLTNDERQYLLTARRQKCLAETAVATDFEKLSVGTSNSFKNLKSTMSELNNSASPKSLVFQKTTTSNNSEKAADTTKTDFYIIGFNGAVDEFYFLEVDSDGDINNHGKYTLTANGNDLISVQTEYCTYRSQNHSIDSNLLMSFKTVIETNPIFKVSNLVTREFSVDGSAPLFFSKSAKSEVDVTTDDRGETRKISTITLSNAMARVSGKYASLNLAAAPFCEYYKTKFSDPGFGDCSLLSYQTVVDQLVLSISK